MSTGPAWLLCDACDAARVAYAATAAVARDPAAIRAAVSAADARGIAVSPWLRRASERGLPARTLRS